MDDKKISCYCMHCAHPIEVSAIGVSSPPLLTPLQTSSLSPVSDLVTVHVTTPSIGPEFVIYLDGEEVLRTLGGNDTIRVEPGEYEVKVKTSIFATFITGFLKDGTKILVSPKFMGFKISIVG